jgi:hypothetical protein
MHSVDKMQHNGHTFNQIMPIKRPIGSDLSPGISGVFFAVTEEF